MRPSTHSSQQVKYRSFKVQLKSEDRVTQGCFTLCQPATTHPSNFFRVYSCEQKRR